MANLAGFDASQVGDMQTFDALPEGQYVVIATASEMKPTKTGTGKYLQFTLEVLDGPYKNRKLFARLNLVNSNQMAVDIAQRELGAICKAVGIIKPNDSAELHNRPMLVSVGVEIDDKKRESNVIRKYEPVGALNGSTRPVETPATAAPWGAPAAPAAAPAPAQAPWGSPAQSAPAAPAQSAPWK